MADKTITIDVFDAEYDTTTVGSQLLKDQNNTPDPNFTGAFNTTNQGLSGCSFSNNTFENNWIAANGIPSSSAWKPVAYNKSAPPSPGFCAIFYRDTPLPVYGSGGVEFAGTTVNTAEYVTNGNFSGGVAAWENIYAVYAPFSFYYGILFGQVGLPTNSTQAWWGTYTICSNVGYGAYNPTSNFNPTILNGEVTLRAGIPDTCGAGGSASYTSIYQVIDNLTPGTEYYLEIISTPDVAGMSYLSLGFSGTITDATTGTAYTALGGGVGGTPGSIYGQYAGSLWGGANTISPQTTGHFDTLGGTQGGYFIAQSSTEVLAIQYMSDNSLGNATDFKIQNISIKEAQQQPVNSSGMYGVVDCYDTNLGQVPALGKIRLNIQNIDDSITGDAITICFNQAPLAGSAAGLEALMTTSMTISNNPTHSPTHPMIMGSHAYSFFVNQTSSTGAWNANDRMLQLNVANYSGNTVIITEVDVEFWSYTTPTTYQTIDYERSMVGTLEVSNSEDFPLNISYNISDGKELDARFGDYSQTFDLPATANNNKTLNHIWKANVDQEQKQTWGIKDCTVNVDGIPFFSGSMQIKASSHDTKAKSYSCTLYGGNFSWMTLLKDKELCKVFDDSETFLYDYFTIEAQWLLLPGTQPIIQFPLVSYRDFNVGGLANYVNCQDLNKPPDIIPSFYVNAIFKRIFENIGYTVSSQFLERQHIQRLLTNFPFLSNSAKDDAVHFSSEQRRNSGDFQTVQADKGLASLTTSWTTCILNHNVTDPAQCYDNSTGVWTCQKAGTYDIYANMGFVIQLTSDVLSTCGSVVNPTCDWAWTPSSPDDSWTWASRVKCTTAAQGVVYGNTTSSGWGQTTMSPLDWWLAYCWDASTQYLTVPSFSIILDVGDTIELQGRHVGQSVGGCEPKVNTLFGYDAATSSIGNQQPWMSITYNNNVPTIGSTVPYNDILPCSISQIDFIKGLSHLFNLYFTTDVKNKVIYIEPFNEFFKEASKGLDWSTKVDYSQDIEDKYDIGLKSELNIGYKVDTGDRYAEIMNTNANGYGDTTKMFDYNETLGEDFESGKVEILNPVWASTTQVWDNDAQTF